MQDHVAAIRNGVKEVQSYSLLPNLAGAEVHNEWVLCSTFANQEAMNAYRVAELHQDFVAFCEPYTESFKAAFFETPHM